MGNLTLYKGKSHFNISGSNEIQRTTPIIKDWPSSLRNTRLEKLFTRLRIGYTWLTFPVIAGHWPNTLCVKNNLPQERVMSILLITFVYSDNNRYLYHT